MKKLLLILSLFMTLSANAQVALVGRTPMGWGFDRARQSIVREFGEPTRVHHERLIYSKGCTFHGVNYDRAEFKFDDGLFNEAIFRCYVADKQSALQLMDSVAAKMSGTFNLSKDKEDAGRWFYKGGKSPLKVGYLFTIYTYPHRGSYVTELRYGPVKFKKED